MELIHAVEEQQFDTGAIGKGDLIHARFQDWEQGRAGLVFSASGGELRVLFLPVMGGATQFFVIPAAEVAAGRWTIRWSRDLETIHLHEGAEP